MIIRLLKNWTLPIAMLTGAILYFAFAKIPFMAPLKPCIKGFVSFITPILLFVQLFVTFCKIKITDLKPGKWHIWLILFQTITTVFIAVFLIFTSDTDADVIAEGAMVCLICPTATAAPVITGKLGGSAASLTTYTLISNLAAALIVPLFFPLVEHVSDMGFWTAFFRILSKVFPLLIFPFIAAQMLRYLWPWANERVTSCKNLAFYIWAIALALVVGQTIRSILSSNAPLWILVSISLVSLVCCCVQFYLGKNIGGHYKERISGGQALGQKNTVFAIWMAYTYLPPITSVAPGTYVVWQNIINSWQLWKKRKREEAEKPIQG